jgi:hypothetical protein
MNLFNYENLFDAMVAPPSTTATATSSYPDFALPYINLFITIFTGGGGGAFAESSSPSFSGGLGAHAKQASSSTIVKCENPLDILIDRINNRIGDGGGAAATALEADDAFIDQIFSIPRPDEAPRDSKKPVSVYAIYHINLNILTIHKAVRAKYAANISQNPKKYIPEWIEYCAKVKEYLKDYIFVSMHAIDGVDADDMVKYKLSLINTYILLSNRYISIVSYHKSDNKDGGVDAENCCPACRPLCCETLIDINGMSVCPKCGKEFKESTKLCVYTENNKIDLTSKIIYEDLTNFLKRLDAYEGKQKNKPPIAIIKQLVDYFDIENDKLLLKGKSCREIKDMEHNHEKKAYSSFAVLEEAFKATKNTAYYKDIELVANWVWGWHFPDISSIKQDVINDYVLAQKAYDEIKERESSLNINLRLIYHLKARDFDCDIKDFKIISSTESIDYHRRMFKGISEKTGIPYVDFF